MGFASPPFESGDLGMQIRRFCFSANHNDHVSYPRSLVEAAPEGWSYRGTDVEFDPVLGRPWARFEVQPGEFIHASSLLPTNSSPWVFDTDHAEYLVLQAQWHRSRDRDEIEARICQSLRSPWCRAIFAWSDASRESLHALYRRQRMAPPMIHVVYPVPLEPPQQGGTDLVDSEDDRPHLERLQARLTPGSTRLLAIDGQTGHCAIAGRKNFRDVLLCFRELRRRNRNVELILVGPSEPVEFEPGVHVLPKLVRRGVHHLYGLADILLYLSRQDSFGTVLLEALRFSGACVAGSARSIPVTRELIEHGRNGYLIPFADDRAYPEQSDGLPLAQLADIVDRLVSSPKERERLRRASALDFGPGGRFSPEVRNRQVEEILRASDGRQQSLGAQP